MQVLGGGVAGVAELDQDGGQCLDADSELWLPELDSMQSANDVSSSLSDWMAGLTPTRPSNDAASTHGGLRPAAAGLPDKCSPVQQQPSGTCGGGGVGGRHSSSSHGSSCGAAPWGVVAPQALPSDPARCNQPPHPGALSCCYPAAANSPYGSSNWYTGVSGSTFAQAAHSHYWPPGSNGCSSYSSYNPAGSSFHASPAAAAYYGQQEMMTWPEAGPAGGTYPSYPMTFGSSSLPAAAQGMGLPPAPAQAAAAGASAGFCACYTLAGGWPYAGGAGGMGVQPAMMLPSQQECGYGAAGACLMPAYQPSPLAPYSQPLRGGDSSYHAAMQASAGPVGGQLSSSYAANPAAGVLAQHCSSSSFGSLAMQPLRAASGARAPAAMQISPSPSGGSLAHCTLPPPPAAAADTSPGSLSAASGDAAAPVAMAAAVAASKPPARLSTRGHVAAPAATPTKPRAKAAAPAASPAASASAVRRLQQGGVSKPPRGSSSGANKPEVLSKAVKRRIKEEQEQSDMQASSDKIKGLTDKKERLSTALQQLQASRDKAAAALAKLKGAYDTMTADNNKLRSDNTELQGLIEGLKQQLRLQGVAVPTPEV